MTAIVNGERFFDQASIDEGSRPQSEAKTLFLYTLLGPQIGWLLIFVLMAFFVVTEGIGSVPGLADILSNVAMAAVIYVYGVMFAYFLGGAQAFATGVILKLRNRDGRFTWLEALLAPLAVSLAAYLVIALWIGSFREAMGVSASLGMVSIASSLILRWLYRKSFRPIAHR